MVDEAEAVKELLSRLTMAPFKIEDPKPGHSLYGNKRLRWFVICPDGAYYKQTAHVNEAWAEDPDDIWLESSILDFVTDLVEEDYGELAGVKFFDMPLHDFSDPQFRQEFKKEFPRTAKRIESYDQVASQVSSRSHVQVRMRYKNIKRETMLTMGARIEAWGMDLQSRLKAVEKNVHALKEAYDEIRDLRTA